MTTILVLILSLNSGAAYAALEFKSVAACENAIANMIAGEPLPAMRATLARHSYCIGAA